jgi:hypothetical protein
MLALLSAIFGFAAPFLPEVFKWINRKQDNAHELAMLEMRMKMAGQEHLYRMEEINAQADIAEAKELHKPSPSFGVQILDKAQSTLKPWAWIPVFWAFSFLDFISGLVRPSVTYLAFGFYVAYKFACYNLMFHVVEPGTLSTAQAIANLWGEQDWGVLTLVLSYYFGIRAHKATFGGNASHGERGK